MCIAASLVREKQKTMSALFIIVVAATLVRKNKRKKCINYFYYCSYFGRKRAGAAALFAFIYIAFFFCIVIHYCSYMGWETCRCSCSWHWSSKKNYCRYIGTETCRRGSCFWPWWALSLSASTRVSFSLRLFTAPRLCSNAKGHWAT